jgi:hypothetical protein
MKANQTIKQRIKHKAHVKANKIEKNKKLENLLKMSTQLKKA